MFGLVITLIFVLIAVPSFYKARTEFTLYWSKGIVPPKLQYNSENLRLIYISLSGLLVGKHPVEVHRKLNFLYKFILKNAGPEMSEIMHSNSDYYQDIKSSLLYSRKHPVKISSVSDWFNKHRVSENQKLALIQFLTDLAYVDLQIHPAELQVISTLASQLNIPAHKLNAIIDPFRQEQENRARREQENWKSRAQNTVSNSSQQEKYCALIGISMGATNRELKKAYRKLVLIYHPDKFVNSPQHEYDAAQKKFIEIQRAYEALEKVLSAGK